MTGSGHDFGETLRRALNVAGQVEPADDGLERIRAQVRARTPRPRLAAALAAVFPWPVYRLLQYRTMVGDALRQWLAELIAFSGRLGRWLSRNTTVAARELRQAGTAATSGPRHAAEHDPLSDHIGWVRPALAAASVAFAATLAMTVPPVRQAIVQLGSVMSTGQTQGASGGTFTNGAHTMMNSPGQGIGTGSPFPSPSVTPTSSCAGTANPTPSGAGSGAATAIQANRATTTCATPSTVPTLPPTSPATSVSPTVAPTTPPPTTEPSTTPPTSNPSDAPSTPAGQAGQVTSTP